MIHVLSLASIFTGVPISAMLLHPLMLAGAGGAMVPLLLHFLSRSRYRSVAWGAMIFMPGGQNRSSHSAKLRQWTLLGLRMSLVGLLAIALARPVIGARYGWVPTAGLTTGGRAAVVIILDDSPSMGFSRDGKSRLDQARGVTLQILASLKRGDEAALLLAGSRDNSPAVPLNADLQSIASRVADLQPDTAPADFALELIRAADMLDRATPANREIYLVCDRQSLSWKNVNDAFRQRWSARRSNGSVPRLTVVPVGGTESDNLTVDAIDFHEHAVIRDRNSTAQIRIRNYGSTSVAAVPLSVWSGSRTIFDTTVDVPAFQSTTVNVPVRFGEVGSKVVSAAIKSVGLTNDDRIDLALDVVEFPKVLVIDRSAWGASTQPVNAVMKLLQSFAVDRGIKVPAATRPASTTRSDKNSSSSSSVLDTTDLSQRNVVVLNTMSHLSETEVGVLRKFVTRGGGLLVLPDADTVVSDFNTGLLGGSAGKPSLIRAKVSEAITKPTHLAQFDRQLPMLQSIPTKLEQSINIRRFFPVIPSGNEVQVLARYSTGEPFLLETKLGQGHILMLTTAIDSTNSLRASLSWNNLSASTLWPALLESMTCSVFTSSAVDRNLWPFQPISVSIDEVIDERSASVQFLSGGGREPVNVSRQGGRTEIRFGRTARPGVYRLRYRTAGRERILNYVIAAGRAESDLSPLTDEQWASLNSRIRLNRVDLSQTTVAAALNVQRGGREIWIDLIAGVLVMLTLEMLVAKWWTT